MDSQYYISMRTLKRTTRSLEDALDSLELDGEYFAQTEEGKSLPYCSKIYLTGGKVSGYFEVVEPVKYLVKIFIFENHQERVDFLLTEKQS